jgi:hypothetical protein
LGQHGAGGVVHRGEQMGLPAVASGAAQCLAVDCDRPSPLARTVTVGKPRADRGGQGLGVKPGEVRRIVVSVGTTQRSGASRRAPSAARTGCGVSAAHSAIAVIDRAPVRTAAAAMARIATNG